MKAVILAGGRGTRISEETSLRLKPMVEIGGAPGAKPRGGGQPIRRADLGSG